MCVHKRSSPWLNGTLENSFQIINIPIVCPGIMFSNWIGGKWEVDEVHGTERGWPHIGGKYFNRPTWCKVVCLPIPMRHLPTYTQYLLLANIVIMSGQTVELYRSTTLVRGEGDTNTNNRVPRTTCTWRIHWSAIIMVIRRMVIIIFPNQVHGWPWLLSSLCRALHRVSSLVGSEWVLEATTC